MQPDLIVGPAAKRQRQMGTVRRLVFAAVIFAILQAIVLVAIINER